MQVILLPLEFTVQFHFYFLSVPLSLDKPPEGGSALVQILHWSFAEAASGWIQSWQIQQQQAGDASKQGELGHSAAPKWLPCRLSQLFITASASSELLWKGNKFYHRFCDQERREKITCVTSDIHGKICKALSHLKSLFWTNFNRFLHFEINLQNSVEKYLREFQLKVVFYDALFSRCTITIEGAMYLSGEVLRNVEKRL